MIFNAKISYTIDEGHPDIKYIKDWTKEKVFTFSDTYTITIGNDYSIEDVIGYIKNDLKLVAGGGYDTEHIHNILFDISRTI